jgi:hypothetical protein
MHTRTDDYRHSMGWFVGLSPVTIALDIHPALSHDRYGVLLERCAEAIRYVREDAAVPFPVIEDRLGVRSSPRFVISFLDLRFFPGADRFDAVRARGLRCPVTAADEVYLWITRTPSGLSYSARVAGDRATLSAFASFMASLVAVLSEFPVAALGDLAAALTSPAVRAAAVEVSAVPDTREVIAAEAA